jgi:hypothetical protein
MMARAIYNQRPHQYWDHSEQTNGWVYADYDEVDEGWRELATKQADAALSALRQWLADEGLVVVPREETDKMIFAAEDVLALSRRGGAVSQTLVSPAAGIWEAMIAAAPDALREGE